MSTHTPERQGDAMQPQRVHWHTDPTSPTNVPLPGNGIPGDIVVVQGPSGRVTWVEPPKGSRRAPAPLTPEDVPDADPWTGESLPLSAVQVLADVRRAEQLVDETFADAEGSIVAWDRAEQAGGMP